MMKRYHEGLHPALREERGPKPAYPTKELAREREKKLKQFGSAYKGLLKRIKLI